MSVFPLSFLRYCSDCAGIGYVLDVCFLPRLLYLWGRYWPRSQRKLRNAGARIPDLDGPETIQVILVCLQGPTSVSTVTQYTPSQLGLVYSFFCAMDYFSTSPFWSKISTSQNFSPLRGEFSSKCTLKKFSPLRGDFFIPNLPLST